ncbi:zinc finger and SCAN domain-containing protein 16-like [Tiliqua scincoides]|uniref:zinc finger and SCAN domain-containing protein 16-like n=1 Tax=Tiliqua scincoides TaxID=71010 RepID=UPI003461DA77
MVAVSYWLGSSQIPVPLNSGRVHQAYPPLREDSVGTQSETKAPHSACVPASMESHQQRFHSHSVPSGETPLETLSRLRDAARQWLRPEERTKEQIVDMVILEQFLAVLPADLQIWLRAREPSSSTEAACLAETFLGQQKPADVTKVRNGEC